MNHIKSLKLCLTFGLALFLTACGERLESPIIQESSSSVSSQSGSSSAEASSDEGEQFTDDTHPPEAGMVRSLLTNEWITEEAAALRPIAVMTPNESAAIPHYNLSKASVIYEANVEGRMTRMLAIYEDWKDLDKIGNIRSLRTYYGFWALEWDAFIVHWGGPFFINELIDKPDVEHLDGAKGIDSSGFFRSTDREDPHNSYASGPALKSLIQDKGYSLTDRGLKDPRHFQFTSRSKPNTLEQYSDCQKATLVDMSSCYPLTRCYFEYNEEDNLYYRYQHLSGTADGPHLDTVTGEQLTFSNLLVQYTKHEELGEGYLAFQCHDTTRDGWFFTNGKGIHVTWEKNSDFGATRFYDDTGNEITLNTGKTMILIVEDGDSFHFE